MYEQDFSSHHLFLFQAFIIYIKFQVDSTLRTSIFIIPIERSELAINNPFWSY
jgi:hypothetical protein